MYICIDIYTCPSLLDLQRYVNTHAHAHTHTHTYSYIRESKLKSYALTFGLSM